MSISRFDLAARRHRRELGDDDDQRRNEQIGNLMGLNDTVDDNRSFAPFADQMPSATRDRALDRWAGNAVRPPEPDEEPEPDPDQEPEPEPEDADRRQAQDALSPEPSALSPLPPARALAAEITAALASVDVQMAVVPQATDLVARAAAVVVTDEASWQAGIDVFDLLRTCETAVHAYFDEDCDAAHKLWKSLTDKRGAQLKPIETARKALGDRCATWRAADTRRKADEARRLEQQALEEQRAAANRQARQLVKAGAMEEAAAVIAEAKTAPAPVIQRAAPVTSTKAVTRESWVGVIVDWPALRAQIGRGECPEFDETLQAVLLPLLTRQAGVLKGELGKRYAGTEGRTKATTAGR